MTTRLICAALAAAWCALAAAQTVYESKDKSGAPVFSDQTSPGAKPMDLPPPNVVHMPPLPKKAPAAAPAPAYTSLAVVTPENDGTVHSNTGAFDVTVKVAPALRARAGDRIRLKLNGALLPSAYSGGKIGVTASDWQAAGSSDGKHTLQAIIVDKTGAAKFESPPVSFYVHRAAVGERRGR